MAIVRISVSSTQQEADGLSSPSSISADGRYITFSSSASNLDAGDTNGAIADVFVYDRDTGTITLVTPGANSESVAPTISGDGRFIVFASAASNLVATDPNGTTQDIFIYDLTTGTTTLLTPNADNPSANPQASSDGRYVVFQSNATNLDINDTNTTVSDIFVLDRTTGTITILTSGSTGESSDASVSADGRFVTFASDAPNLSAADTNGIATDVFLYDRDTGALTVVSAGGNDFSYQPAISADGRFVTYASSATNLDPNDTNGSRTDIFLYDSTTGTTTLLTPGGDSFSSEPSISADGRYVAYWSFASNLVATDPNGATADIFVYDRVTGNTALLSSGGDLGSYSPQISADGRFVTFQSDATNLVANDTNNTTDVFAVENPLFVSPNSAPNAAPVVLASIDEDSGPRLITAAELLAGSTDVDLDPLSITSLSIQTGNGTLVDNGNGTWTYTSDKNDDTDVTFAYTVSDGALTASSTATLDITPVNDRPTAKPITLTAIDEDSGARIITQAELLAGAADVDGPLLRIDRLVIQSGNGTVVKNSDGTWTYTPAADDDTSVTFLYTSSDGAKRTSSTATLDITSVNDAPVASPVVLASIAEDSGARIITTAELLAGVQDVDSTTLTITSLTIQTGNGALVDNGDGTWTYTPATNDDADVTFAYTVSDGTLSASSTASLDITPENDAPVALPVVLASIAEDSGARIITSAELLAGVQDIDSTTLTITSFSIQTGNGALVDNGNGTWTYTGAKDDDTGVTFTYTVSDGALSATSTASLDITPVNDRPTAKPITLTAIDEDSGPRIITQAELLAGAADVDGPLLRIDRLVIQSGNGTVVKNNDGTWTYTPAANDDTSVVFLYTASDGAMRTSSTATLDIKPVNDAPVASPVVLASIAEDSGARIITAADLLAGVQDIDSTTLTITSLAKQSGNGTLVDNGNGTWTYTPAANDDTGVTFGYTVSDGALSASSTATLDITPTNDAATGGVSYAFAYTAGGLPSLLATSTIQDIDGLIAPIAYQWQTSSNGGQSWTNIPGATSLSYVPATAPNGQQIRITAVATDAFGSTNFASSAYAVYFGNSTSQTIKGSNGADIIAGLAGNDCLYGNGGADVIYAGIGNDVVYGGTGADTLFGEDGNDKLFGDADNDTLNGGAGDDCLYGGDGNDVLTGGAGLDTLDGGKGNDRFVAAAGDGNDCIYGSTGTDTLDLSATSAASVVNLGGTVVVGNVAYTGYRATSSSAGTDTISSIENVIGGSGRNTIIASTDLNVLTGGGSADTFVFVSAQAAGRGLGSRDIINDFLPGTDKIDLSVMDAVLTSLGNQAFAFAGFSATGATPAAGQISYHYETIGGAEKTIIDGNIRSSSNDTTLDFQIELAGRLTLGAGDFIL